ncbi:MAG: hypothetical protein J0653_06980, partial [Deltaproteobacteria bacterium]|nr:hypothetical protein [Deltaproteobacteria bacterium]
NGVCSVNYTLTNQSDNRIEPIVRVRFQDQIGNTVGEEVVFFNLIDPWKMQKMTKTMFNCNFTKAQVLIAELRNSHHLLCGVSGKTYSW